MTEPHIGSFKFGLRLVDPLQLPMFHEDQIRGQDIANTMFRVVESVSSNLTPAESSELLKTYVPKPDYRRAMLQIVRNIVPDGKSIEEIEFSLTEQRQVRTTTLYGHTKSDINQILAMDPVPKIHHGGEYREYVGILRALHLDLNWLEIIVDDDTTQRCEIVHDVLNDVVGPMVNRQVNVKGQWYPDTGVVELIDIELDESDS